MSSVDITSRSEKQSRYPGAINLHSVSSLVVGKRNQVKLNSIRKLWLTSAALS